MGNIFFVYGLIYWLKIKFSFKENYVVSKNFDGNSWFMDSFNRDRDQGVCG